MSDNTVATPAEEMDEQQILVIRKEKLDEIREQGQAFPNDFQRDSLAAQIIEQYDAQSKEQLETLNKRFVVAGRVMLRRIMGKASFVHLQDMSGQIQLYVRRDDLQDDNYEDFKKWDLGDIIGAEGKLFKTKTGELSIKVDKIRLLTKSLRPLPDKFHGLTDVEARYRQRYIDLIMNETTRKTFQIRSKLVAAIRQFMADNDFTEVETPMMQSIPGGATARPFVTHHNTLDMQLFLRIAPELFLKRLVVGGIERVYEINRNFRNEGISTRHNPEFTMLEFYQAYADYEDLMDFTEKMLQYCAQTVLGSLQVQYQEQTYDFAKPFHRFTLKESISHFNPEITQAQLSDEAQARALCEQLKIPVRDGYGLGKLQLEIFEKTTEHLLMEPTFITAYPTEVSPLARRNSADPFITDRFEFFIHGRELANGFSELNDPEDQAQRFLAQVEERDAGDAEAMHYDADYITALEYGMPPTAGEGIGIDRLAMLFTDSASIRDVILFPQLRSQD